MLIGIGIVVQAVLAVLLASALAAGVLRLVEWMDL